MYEISVLISYNYNSHQRDCLNTVWKQTECMYRSLLILLYRIDWAIFHHSLFFWSGYSIHIHICKWEKCNLNSTQTEDRHENKSEFSRKRCFSRSSLHRQHSQWWHKNDRLQYIVYSTMQLIEFILKMQSICVRMYCYACGGGGNTFMQLNTHFEAVHVWILSSRGWWTLAMNFLARVVFFFFSSCVRHTHTHRRARTHGLHSVQ